MKRFLVLVIVLAAGFYIAWPAYNGMQIKQALKQNEPEVLKAKIDFPSVRQSMRAPVLDQLNQRIAAVLARLGPASGFANRMIPHDNIEKIVDGTLNSVVEPVRIAQIYSSGGDLNGAIKDAVLAEIDKMGGLLAVLKLDKLLGGADRDDKSGAAPSATSPDNTAPGHDATATPPDANEPPDTIAGFKVPKALQGFLKDKKVRDAIDKFANKHAITRQDLADKLFPSHTKGKRHEPDGRAADATPAQPRQYGLGNIKSFSMNGPLAFEIGFARQESAEAPELTAEMAFRNYDWRVTKLIPNLLDR